MPHVVQWWAEMVAQWHELILLRSMALHERPLSVLTEFEFTEWFSHLSTKEAAEVLSNVLAENLARKQARRRHARPQARQQGLFLVLSARRGV
jgi:hypothetical protein